MSQKYRQNIPQSTSQLASSTNQQSLPDENYIQRLFPKCPPTKQINKISERFTKGNSSRRRQNKTKVYQYSRRDIEAKKNRIIDAEQQQNESNVEHGCTKTSSLILPRRYMKTDRNNISKVGSSDESSGESAEGGRGRARKRLASSSYESKSIETVTRGIRRTGKYMASQNLLEKLKRSHSSYDQKGGNGANTGKSYDTGKASPSESNEMGSDSKLTSSKINSLQSRQTNSQNNREGARSSPSQIRRVQVSELEQSTTSNQVENRPKNLLAFSESNGDMNNIEITEIFEDDSAPVQPVFVQNQKSVSFDCSVATDFDEPNMIRNDTSTEELCSGEDLIECLDKSTASSDRKNFETENPLATWSNPVTTSCDTSNGVRYFGHHRSSAHTTLQTVDEQAEHNLDEPNLSTCEDSDKNEQDSQIQVATNLSILNTKSGQSMPGKRNLTPPGYPQLVNPPISSWSIASTGTNRNTSDINSFSFTETLKLEHQTKVETNHKVRFVDDRKAQDIDTKAQVNELSRSVSCDETPPLLDRASQAPRSISMSKMSAENLIHISSPVEIPKEPNLLKDQAVVSDDIDMTGEPLITNGLEKVSLSGETSANIDAAAPKLEANASCENQDDICTSAGRPTSMQSHHEKSSSSILGIKRNFDPIPSSPALTGPNTVPTNLRHHKIPNETSHYSLVRNGANNCSYDIKSDTQGEVSKAPPRSSSLQFNTLSEDIDDVVPTTKTALIFPRLDEGLSSDAESCDDYIEEDDERAMDADVDADEDDYDDDDDADDDDDDDEAGDILPVLKRGNQALQLGQSIDALLRQQQHQKNRVPIDHGYVNQDHLDQNDIKTLTSYSNQAGQSGYWMGISGGHLSSGSSSQHPSTSSSNQPFIGIRAINGSSGGNSIQNMGRPSNHSFNREDAKSANRFSSDTDNETDRLLGSQRNDQMKLVSGNDTVALAETSINHSTDSQPTNEVSKSCSNSREVLIEGVLFNVKYLGSTHTDYEGRSDKEDRIHQAEMAVHEVKFRNGDSQPATDVQLFISTEKIMVLDDKNRKIMMDHSLRTISYIADIGDAIVLIVRKKSTATGEASGSNEISGRPVSKISCHVFESQDSHTITKSVSQAFQVAYAELLKSNGTGDSSNYLPREVDYQDVLNSQEMSTDELDLFSRKENQREVIVPKEKGEILGITIVESGWGSLLPTVVIAALKQEGPAYRCKKLSIGDQILSVNGISLVGLPLSECQDILRRAKNQRVARLSVVPCPITVEVKIKRPDTKYQLGFSVQNGVVSS